MKKFSTIIFSALMAVAALSSCAEKEIVTYNPENAVAPVLDALQAPEGGYVLVNGENFATLTFSPADFGVTTAIRYTAYADTDESFATKQSLGNVATDTAGLTVASNVLNNALMTLESEPDVPVTVYFRIEAEMMGESAVVGTVDAMISNTVSASVIPYNAERTYPVVYVVGGPWGWPNETWSNTEAFRYLFSYSEDEENYVGVIDFGEAPSSYEFKITGAASWDNATGNWGSGESTSSEADAGQLILANGGGNITNYSSYRYYNFHFVKSSMDAPELNMIRGFNQVGIIGLNDDWDNDVVMTQIARNGQFYADIEVASATSFKFRLNAVWTDGDWGGSVDALVSGGGNIPIEPGNYRVYLDLNNWDAPTARLSTSDYGDPIE